MEAEAERILLAQAQDGDERSFEALVNAHSAKTIRLAWRLVGNQEDAEDLAQEAFVRLYKSIGSFRGESSISTWLYRTLTRLAIDHLRRQKLKRKIFFMRSTNEDPDPVDQASDPNASPGKRYLAGEAGRRVDAALQKLSVRQRMVFTLRHHEGLPLKEIAETLGLEEGTVKVHLHRAVHFLRQELQDLQGGLS